MSVDINSLRQKRSKITDQARAILDKVPDDQTISAADEERFDKLMTEADDLDDQITRAEVERERERRRTDRLVGGEISDGMFRFRTADGREVPGLLAEHRLSDLPEFRSQGKGSIFDDVDVDDLSLGRFVIAAVTGDWSHAPAEEAAMRAMTTTPDSGGGFLIPGALSSMLIDEARSQSVLIPAGAITVPMTTSTLDIARVTGSPSAEFRAVGEELVALPSTQATLGRITLRALTLGAVVDLSEELIENLLIEASSTGPSSAVRPPPTTTTPPTG